MLQGSGRDLDVFFQPAFDVVIEEQVSGAGLAEKQSGCSRIITKSHGVSGDIGQVIESFALCFYL